MSRRNRWTAMAATAALVTAGTAVATALSRPASAAAPAFSAAPYFMPLDNDPQNLSDAISATGQKHYILAFVLAPNGGGCTPTWDGSTALTDDAAVQAQISAVRAAGGDVGVSFGGYNGVELGAACGSASALASAYQQVIDRYDLSYVDFDIEGDDLGALSAEQTRFQAITQLENNAAAKGRYLTVALTIPVATVGLTGSGVDEVQAAHDLGTRIDYFNIMDFDYGGSGSTQVQDDITVADDVHAQLKKIYTNWSDADAYAHTGMTLMNGHTDQASELFTQSTFSSLLNYVQQHNIGFFSFWSLNRDRQCDPNGNYGWVAGVCSSISQQPWDFTKIIANRDGGGGAPPPTSSPTPPPSPSPTSSSSPSPGGGLLTNGGFESGLAGWSCTADDTTVSSPTHSGSAALAGTPSSSDYARCAQTVAVQPNTTYQLAGYIDGSYVYLGANGASGDTNTWTAGTSGYTKLALSITTGASQTSMTVYVHGWYGEPTFYADDITLTGPGGATSPSPSPSSSPSPTPTPSPTLTPTPTPTPSPTPSPTPTPTPSPTSPPPASGSLVNGGFENGLSPWTCQSGSGVVSSPVHSGSHALAVAATSSQTGECDQTVTLSPNTSYTLTGWVQGNYAYIGVSGGASASTWTSSSSWTQLTVRFTTGSNGAVTVFVHGWYGQGNVYADDVTLN